MRRSHRPAVDPEPPWPGRRTLRRWSRATGRRLRAATPRVSDNLATASSAERPGRWARVPRLPLPHSSTRPWPYQIGQLREDIRRFAKRRRRDRRSRTVGAGGERMIAGSGNPAHTVSDPRGAVWNGRRAPPAAFCRAGECLCPPGVLRPDNRATVARPVSPGARPRDCRAPCRSRTVSTPARGVLTAGPGRTCSTGGPGMPRESDRKTAT